MKALDRDDSVKEELPEAVASYKPDYLRGACLQGLKMLWTAMGSCLAPPRCQSLAQSGQIGGHERSGAQSKHTPERAYEKKSNLLGTD